MESYFSYINKKPLAIKSPQTSLYKQITTENAQLFTNFLRIKIKS
jgi:hypothetical protein